MTQDPPPRSLRAPGDGELVDSVAAIALRRWRPVASDAAALAEAWDDEAVSRWTDVPARHDRVAAASWIASEPGRAASGRVLDLVIAPVDDLASVCGEVGLRLTEPDRGWAEIGFWVGVAARGRGCASGAVRLLADWALDEGGLSSVYARVHERNPASEAVLYNAGFVLAGALLDRRRLMRRISVRPD